MGLGEGTELRTLDVSTPDPHPFAAQANDPVARDARLWACFSAD